MRMWWKDFKRNLRYLSYDQGPLIYLLSPLFLVIATAVGVFSWSCSRVRDLINAGSFLKETISMAVKGQSVYAVAFWGGQIELRRCKRPPRQVKTVFEKDTEVRVPRYVEDADGRETIRWDKVPRKIALNSVVHSGGRVVGTTNQRRVYTIAGKTLAAGEVLKLTPTQAAKLLGTKP